MVALISGFHSALKLHVMGSPLGNSLTICLLYNFLCSVPFLCLNSADVCCKMVKQCSVCNKTFSILKSLVATNDQLTCEE